MSNSLPLPVGQLASALLTPPPSELEDVGDLWQERVCGDLQVTLKQSKDRNHLHTPATKRCDSKRL